MSTTKNEPITDTMTREEAAKYLGVSLSFLSLDVVNRRHGIPYYKLGRRCVYSRTALDQWRASRMVNAPAAAV